MKTLSNSKMRVDFETKENLMHDMGMYETYLWILRPLLVSHAMIIYQNQKLEVLEMTRDLGSWCSLKKS